jgi:hypothetical protein
MHWQRRLGVVAVAFVLAAAQLRLVMFVFGARLGRSMEATAGVADGLPHWRIYQGRVLSPYSIEGLAEVLPSYATAWLAFAVLALTLAGYRAWRLGELAAGERGGPLGLAVLHVGFALLLSPGWLYPWDLVDVVVFTWFCELVLVRAPWPRMVVLVAVGALNHEITLFLALWLPADAVARWWLAPPAARAFDWRPAAVGVATFALGYFLVETLRDGLLVQEVGPLIFADAPADIGSSFYVTLGGNLEQVAAMFGRWDFSLPYLVPLGLLGSAGVAAWLGLADRHRLAGLALVFLAVIAALLLFGVLLETRIYVVLIPLGILAAARVAARAG